jgi:hypothetical protein
LTSPDAASWSATPPPLHEHTWTRVYKRGQREAHIKELVYSAHARKPDRWFDGWLGTGSQEEYDRAAAMPLCPHCFMGLQSYTEES